jgi:8-oxo-dGTP pyrophosphatase MutT (NUDIX family)
VNAQSQARPAATVILLRRTEPNGFEVFLTRRPDDMPVLGGMYCYPGGAVAKEDVAPRLIERSSGLTPAEARRIVGAHLSPQAALGFWIAGIREVFEEIGVLFALHESGGRFPGSRACASRLGEKRAALLGKSLSFLDLLESEDLCCDLARLAYFSHWQTPVQVSVRFDTRFFVAALPQDQIPLQTSYEVTHSLWLSPERAMQLHERGRLPMIFPTFASLRALADFETLESVLKEFGAGRTSSHPAVSITAKNG